MVVLSPTVVLAGLLAYGLALMPELLTPAAEGQLQIAVSAEQWWWRVRYLTLGSNGEAVELANEIRLPVGARVAFHLESPDVIHSFWIPALGGKIDMIPGRRNRLVLEPTQTGVFRGVCAEYCGTSHALMRFDVVVLEQEAFAVWLMHQHAPAQPPTQPLAAPITAPRADPCQDSVTCGYSGGGDTSVVLQVSETQRDEEWRYIMKSLDLFSLQVHASMS